MSTKLFLRGSGRLATTHRGTNTAGLNGATTGWVPGSMFGSAGSGVTFASALTVTGPTSGIEVTSGGSPPPAYEFLSEPLAAAVTISGTITFNIWASENNMSANVAINIAIDRMGPDGAIISRVITTARTTEVAVAAGGVNNFTGTPTSTNFAKGDRIRVRIFGDDAGTMATGFSFSGDVDGGSAGFDGDTFITFTETFSVLTTAPAGSQLFLTDTAGPAVGADIEKEMWTSRGAGVTSIVRNTAAGWTAPLQWTDAGGGTAVAWYSRQLNAFTLADLINIHVRMMESDAAANASARAQIAVVNADGSGAVVWGEGAPMPGSNSIGELDPTAETVQDFIISGPDVAVTQGQRLRLILYVDDCANVPLVTGKTCTLWYAGTSGGASGDSYIQLTQSVTEFVAATVPRYPSIDHGNPGIL